MDPKRKLKISSLKLEVRTVRVIDTNSHPIAVSITEIDDDIEASQKSLSLLRVNRSQSPYIMNVHILAMARFARYQRSHQKEDLDKSILHFTEAIFLPPISQAGSLNLLQMLFRLAFSLLERSEEFEQPDGIKYSIEYLQHLRRFPLDSFDVPRTKFTTSLISALRTQVRLGAGNGTRDIKEMVVLCNEFLSSSTVAVIPAAAFSHLREAVDIELYRGLPTEILDEAIECLRGAEKARPPSYDAWHEVTYALAYTLSNRFRKAHAKEDYEEAIAVLERILEPGGCPDSFRIAPFILYFAIAHERFAIFREPEYSEVAISRVRALLRPEFNSPFLDEELRLLLTSSLAIQTDIRFREYSLSESLEETNSYISQLVNASSSPTLAELPSLSRSEARA